ncbi:Oligopeptide transporter, OPT superfamily [Kalmanozyma brasiliensis GHG001]|nr:Oligopeptide transporter, OPT superfamily [Kalmanozyma brasiliensis GHG001]KAF6767638.1 Oligopeptide transporter, OPT superfamily [Kalmanozyma brasiliensis GHG001]
MTRPPAAPSDAVASVSESQIELVHLGFADAPSPAADKSSSSIIAECKKPDDEVEIADKTGPGVENADYADELAKRSTPATETAPPTPADEKGNICGSTDTLRDEELLEKSDDERVIRNGRDVSDYLVSDRDDGDACFTLRSITLALVGSAFQAVLTQIYRFKPTEIDINGTFLAIIIYVLGTAWARLLPTRESLTARYGQDRLPRWLLATAHTVNPGKFGLKEHAIASITASSDSYGAHSSDVFGTQKLFYPEIKVSNTTAVLSVLSIGLMGYGLAGLCRPILVYPSEMVYWTTLPLVDLFQAFHWEEKGRRTSKRIRVFWYSFAGMGLYEILPAYMFPMLNSISIPCLASMHARKPLATTLTNIFGGAQSNEGMGLLSLSLDWQYITSKHLALPLLQQGNMFIGLAVCYVAMVVVYYTNTWNAKSFPFMSTGLFADDGRAYNQTAVFVDGILDKQRLEAVGYPRVAGTYAWGMTMRTAAIGALVMHVALFWGKYVRTSLKQSRDKTQPDRHWRGMQKYPEAPHWWYLILLVISFVFGLIVVLTRETTMTWYAYLVSLLVGAVVAPISGVLYALLGDAVSTTNITKMIGGVVAPGRPLANLYFYGWSHSTITQVIHMCNDLKMGQYLKIPPRTLFLTQVMGAVYGAFINYAVMSTIVASKFALLHTNTGSNVWSGAYYQSLNISAVSWSMAKYVYRPGTAYFVIPMATVYGMLAVVVQWLFCRYVPKVGRFKTTDLILPLVFYSASLLVSGQNCVVLSILLVAITSQVWVRTRYPRYFKQFNYVVGAGWDGGSLLVIFVLSFAVFGAAGKERKFPTWFGNPKGFPDHCPSPTQ